MKYEQFTGRSRIVNCIIESVPLPEDGVLFNFTNDGKADCVVNLEGVYMTDIKYRGVIGQFRLLIETKQKQLKWNISKYLNWT